MPIFSLQQILKDTNSYKKIEFNYKAKGNERFIYFGNITGSVPSKMIKTNFGFDKSIDRNPIRMILIDDISVFEIQDSSYKEKSIKVEQKTKNTKYLHPEPSKNIVNKLNKHKYLLVILLCPRGLVALLLLAVREAVPPLCHP